MWFFGWDSTLSITTLVSRFGDGEDRRGRLLSFRYETSVDLSEVRSF